MPKKLIKKIGSFAYLTWGIQKKKKKHNHNRNVDRLELDLW
jgi:hypothetical protein